MTAERTRIDERELVQPGRVRRIVTGHDSHGRSVFLSDGEAPNVFRSPSVPGLGSAVVWTSEPGKLTNDGDHDPASADVTVGMYPPDGGTIFRVADFPPDHHYAAADPTQMFDEIGGPDAQVTQDANGSAKQHFWFHQTDSVDYAVVVEGEIWLILDDAECLVRAGDVIVQRGTSHAWSNRSAANCRMVFVLLGAPPITRLAAPGHVTDSRPA